MATAMEIAPNYTIPALPLVPGAAQLLLIPRAGDDQNWPLASAGTDAAATTTPHPWQLIFSVATSGGVDESAE